jgi:hypothetical protein
LKTSNPTAGAVTGLGLVRSLLRLTRGMSSPFVVETMSMAEELSGKSVWTPTWALTDSNGSSRKSGRILRIMFAALVVSLFGFSPDMVLNCLFIGWKL